MKRILTILVLLVAFATTGIFAQYNSGSQKWERFVNDFVQLATEFERFANQFERNPESVDTNNLKRLQQRYDNLTRDANKITDEQPTSGQLQRYQTAAYRIEAAANRIQSAASSYY